MVYYRRVWALSWCKSPDITFIPRLNMVIENKEIATEGMNVQCLIANIIKNGGLRKENNKWQNLPLGVKCHKLQQLTGM